jgi:hypothetical protein
MVIRDGQRRRLFANLLVKGDVIELTSGELAPARARRWSDAQHEELPRHYPHLPADISTETSIACPYILLETPFVQTLREILTAKRPKGVQEQELLRLRTLWRRFLWTILGLSLLASTLRFTLLDLKAAFSIYMEVVYIVLSTLPFGFIVLLLLCRLCATARLISLFELLQTSDAIFEEREDADEFDDEAPPPTKDVNVRFGKLLYIECLHDTYFMTSLFM